MRKGLFLNPAPAATAQLGSKSSSSTASSRECEVLTCESRFARCRCISTETDLSFSCLSPRAKKLRHGDRALNQPSYPALYYPEIYILEGGYCEFYKQQPVRPFPFVLRLSSFSLIPSLHIQVACNPSAYIAMDDPAHRVQRASDIHITRTRRFDRAQSWQGEVPSSRNSNPLFSNATVRPHSSGAPILALAAASAAQGKRRTGGMMVHEEEENSDISFSSTDGLGSPCAPLRSTSSLGPTGSAVGRLQARTALERTASAPLVFGGSNLFGKAR
jgi:M-phase inducer tyrosine phosphatase